MHHNINLVQFFLNLFPVHLDIINIAKIIFTRIFNRILTQ